jgi:cell division protease FtsH
VENQYLDGRSVLNCSDQTAAKIDEEVMKILKNAYDIALDLLRNNMEALDEIAHFLIEKETITGKEFMEIFERIQNEKNAPAESAESPESIEEDTDAVESTESVEENAAPADSTESTEENAATAESTDENTQEV